MMEQKSSPPQKSRFFVKSFVRISTKLFIASLFFLLLIALGVYLGLRSKAVTSKITPRITEELKKLGIESEIGPVSIDIWGNIKLSQSKIKMQQGSISISAALSDITIDYSLWALVTKNKLNVSSIILENPMLDVIIDGLPQANAQPSPTAPTPHLSLEESLRNIPVELNLEQFLLRSGVLHLSFNDKKGTAAELEVDPLNLDIGFKYKAGKLLLLYDINLKEKAPVRISIQNNKLELASSFALEVTQKGELFFDISKDDPSLGFDKIISQIAMAQIDIKATTPEQQLKAKLEKFNFKVAGKLSSKTKGNSSSFFSNPEPLLEALAISLDNILQIEDLDLQLKPKKGETISLSFKKQNFSTALNMVAKSADLDLSLQLEDLKTAPLKDKLSTEVLASIKTADIFLLPQKQGAFTFDTDVTLSKLWVEPLAQAISLSFKNRSTTDLTNHKTDHDIALQLNDKNIVKIKTTLQDLAQNLKIALENELIAGEFFIPLMPDKLKELTKLGEIAIQNNINFTLLHPYDSIAQFSSQDLSRFKISTKIDTQIEQNKDATDKKMPLSIKKPIKITNNVFWQKEKVQHQLELRLEEAAVGSEAKIEDLVLNSAITGKNGVKPDNLEWDIKTKIAALEHKSFAANNDFKNFIKPIKFHSQGSLKNIDTFLIKDVSLSIGQQMLTLNTAIEGSIRKQSVRSRGDLAFELNKLAKNFKIEKGSGQFEMDWDLTAIEAKKLLASSKVKFKKSNIKGTDFAVKDIEGSMTFSEEVELTKDMKVKFSFLQAKDPFQRVDYDLVAPYLRSKDNLSIKKLTFKDWEFGPLNSNLTIDQNLIMAPYFELILFGGSVTGEFFLDIHPEQLKLSLKGLMTNLDAGMLVTRGKALKHKDKNKENKERISGSLAIELDFNRSLLEGRISMTQISEYQLQQLLNIVDPNFEDERIAKLRTALSIGHPRLLEITMKYGYMNVRVEIESAVNSVVEINGIELSHFIAANTSEIKELLRKIPIESIKN